MNKQRVFSVALSMPMLLGAPSCGQAAPEKESSFSHQIPATGTIEEVKLGDNTERDPLSVSISMKSGTTTFQITNQTLFLDSQTGKRHPASDLLEENYACIFPEENSQQPSAEAVLLSFSKSTAVHLHTVEKTTVTESGLLITTDDGSLHLSVPNTAALTFYADSVTVPPEAVQPGDRIFAWYDGIEETYPMQAYTERLVVVPTLENLPETLPEGLSFSVVPGSITPKGASFQLWHNTNAQIEYGSDFALQKLVDGEWRALPFAIENGAFTMEAYNLPKGEPRALEIQWDWLYGELPPGEYRMVKNVMDFHGTGDFEQYPLTAEFSVGEVIACN